MINISLLRTDFENTKKKLERRGKIYPQLDEFKTFDSLWRKSLAELESLNAKKNQNAKLIADLIKQKKQEEIPNISKQSGEIKEKIAILQKQVTDYELKLQELLLSLPNIPSNDTPDGKDESENVLVKTVGKPKKYSFPILSHYDLASKNGLIDFPRAAKLSGSRHSLFLKDGAKLIRVLRDLTIDLHTKNGFSEILPPVIINQKVLYGTGHLPKAEEDMFALANHQYLSPTEEVPLTGFYNGEILSESSLPILLTSSTLSFRSEAGSAGKDVKGIIRQHQFYNTEMVGFCLPKDSPKILKKFVAQCEAVLKLLKLPYRIMQLCSGDIGTAANKTYDIEVWLPSENRYREISSCSECGDYQSRGSMIRYRNDKDNCLGYVYTLNGTATSLNRLWVAIMENYQTKNGKIAIPKALQKYFGNKKYFNE